MDPSVIAMGSIIVGLLAIIIGFGPRVLKNKLQEQTVTLYEKQNSELRQSLTEQGERYEARINDLQIQISELRGQVKMLTPNFARDIAAELERLGA